MFPQGTCPLINGFSSQYGIPPSREVEILYQEMSPQGICPIIIGFTSPSRDKNPLIKGSFLKGSVLIVWSPLDMGYLLQGRYKGSFFLLMGNLGTCPYHWITSWYGISPLIKGSFLKGSVLFTNGQPRIGYRYGKHLYYTNGQPQDLSLSSDHLLKGLSSMDLSFLLMVNPVLVIATENTSIVLMVNLRICPCHRITY